MSLSGDFQPSMDCCRTGTPVFGIAGAGLAVFALVSAPLTAIIAAFVALITDSIVASIMLFECPYSMSINLPCVRLFPFTSDTMYCYLHSRIILPLIASMSVLLLALKCDGNAAVAYTTLLNAYIKICI